MKLRRFTVLLLAFFLLPSLSACGVPEAGAGVGSSLPVSQTAQSSEPVLCTERWKVYNVNEHSLLALPEDAENTGELTNFSLVNVDETNGKLARGAVVEIVYGGATMMCYPGRVTGVKSITVVEQGEDLLTLYLDMLDEIYETDPGLNPEGSMETPLTYGYDLTEVHNLTEVEKSMLAFFFTNSHNTDWEKAQPAGSVFGTYRELVEEGYIDGENLYFENGLLFTVRDEPVEKGKISFSVEKWRSGLGAIFYMDCTARKKDGDWTYELGGFAIS